MNETTITPAAALYGSNAGVRLLRWVLAATQRLWPGLAVRAAARLFATPMPPRWLRRPRAWDAGWRVEPWAFEQASLTLYSPAAVAPRSRIALLAHGWGGHAGQMLPLAQALAQQGMMPVLVEMPAHGRSGGSVSNLPQFVRALEYVAARLQQQGHRVQVVVAHSLGANAAAYAAGRGLPAERLVLIAPPASAREYTRFFANVFGLSEATRSALQARIEAREGIVMPQLEPPAVGPRIDIPTLVVHDRGDRVNRFADGVAFAHAIRGARLLATQGLGHRKILADPGVVGQVAVFAAS
ncbi:MAG TPA: alpha/beta fold hydrolase [Ramlibacter sp.]